MMRNPFRSTRDDKSRDSGGFFENPPVPRRPWWLKFWKIEVAVVVALALVGYLVWPGDGADDALCGGWYDDLYHEFDKGECIGVTDGEYVFNPDFAELQEKIKTENDRVADVHEAKGTPVVKIAMLSTLTVTESSPLSPTQIRNGLAGAYVALYRANHTTQFGDHQPLIQLYLANEGSVQQGWQKTVGTLEGMVDDEFPLVAVTGQAVSTDSTVAAAERLSEAGIPMVTSFATADGLDNDGVKGLIRTSASNTDFALALRQYLDGQDTLESGMLVFDNTEEDLYTSTMVSAFKKRLKEYIKYSHQPYPGCTINSDCPKVFSRITDSICAAKANMVLFVGRPPDFYSFMEALGDRVCRDTDLTVLRAGLHPRDTPKMKKKLEDDNLNILHASSYDPRWAEEAGAAPEGFAKFREYFEKHADHDLNQLQDGSAVNAHDSLAAAIEAVRLASPLENKAPKPAHVREYLLLLNGQNAIHGATGTLSFNDNRGGNPGGKYVPVIEVPSRPDGKQPKTYVTPVD